MVANLRFSFTINNYNSKPSTIRGSSSSILVNLNSTVVYQQYYATLASYALSLINQDRSSFGLAPVSLSPVPSAQQHAYSMLQNGYFSHWDTQGLKPYMRYTLLGGSGAVEENVAYESSSSSSTSTPYFTSVQVIEQALKDLEYDMMYNDSSCCQNDHRENILSPYHNRVSIGVAYDSQHVYFVEDFENYYLGFDPLRVYSPSTETVSIVANTTVAGAAGGGPVSPICAVVFYDPPPIPLTPQELTTPPFNGPYDQGTFAGDVFQGQGQGQSSSSSSCFYFGSGGSGSSFVSVFASSWSTEPPGFIQIQFSLAPFINSKGEGVYTVYVMESGSEELTSLSIFVY
jgi:uncharacterized protein YkwD